MDKCENCEYAVYSPIPNEQIGHEGKSIDNWDCGHPNEEIQRKSRQKGWSETCPEFKPIQREEK